METSNFEERKLSLEEKKVENDFLLMSREFDLKEREIAVREREVGRSRISFTPTNATILIAIIGLMGTFIGSFIQGYNNLTLERQKFESDLILRIATSEDIEQNRENLLFFISTGLISDPRGSLQRVVSNEIFTLQLDRQIERQITNLDSLFLEQLNQSRLIVDSIENDTPKISRP